RPAGGGLDSHTRRSCATRWPGRSGGAGGEVTHGGRESVGRAGGARSRGTAPLSLRSVELLAEGPDGARRKGPRLDEPSPRPREVRALHRRVSASAPERRGA